MESGMSRFDFTDPDALAALTDMLTAAGVDGLEISTPDTEVRLVISVAGHAAKSSSATTVLPRTAASRVVVKAPIAGHFHLSHPFVIPHDDKYPRVVAADDVVGFIRISQVLVPVRAGRAGSLIGQLAEQDALVGYGDPLFELELQS
jgi:biotin carboxyl carrier protein